MNNQTLPYQQYQNINKFTIKHYFSNNSKGNIHNQYRSYDSIQSTNILTEKYYHLNNTKQNYSINSNNTQNNNNKQKACP